MADKSKIGKEYPWEVERGEVTLSGKITRKNESDRRVVGEISARNQQNQLLLTGLFEAVLPRRAGK